LSTTEEVVEQWATDSGHWYRANGEPCYTIIGGNGKERNTTLRDARKLGLYPSVTTIIKTAAAPGLEIWKQQQVMMAALTITRRQDELEHEWLKRIIADSTEQARASAKRGQRIHAAIEKHYRGEPPDEEFWPWIQVVKKALGEHQSFHAERSFAHTLGFGGRLDLHNGTWLIDIKTKDGVEKAEQYDENFMQLAAYRRGMNLAVTTRCANLFVDRKIASVRLCEATEADMQRGWDMFRHLHAHWQAKTGHYP
jgi:hypothetical protein